MGIQPDEPAFNSGLVAGDRIMSVNGKALGSGQEGIMNLVNIIQKSSGKELLLRELMKEKARQFL